MSTPPTSSRAKRHRRSSRLLSWSRRHKFLAAISMVVIVAVPGIAIAAMGNGDGGSPATSRQAVPSTGPTTSSRSVTSTAAPTTKAPPSSRATTTAPPAGVVADAAIKGDIVQLEGGAYHTCLRLRRGAVYCWGQGAYGQLGTNTHFRGTPTRSLVIDDAVEVQAGVASPAPGGPMARSSAGVRTITRSSAAGAPSHVEMPRSTRSVRRYRRGSMASRALRVSPPGPATPARSSEPAR